jgi:hypothetical protein
MTTQAQLSTTVRAAMAVTGETQKELAEVIGVHLNSFNGRMTGRVAWSLDDLDKLADHWGGHPWDLMQGPAKALTRLSRLSTQGYDVSAGQDGASSNPAIDDAA